MNYKLTKEHVKEAIENTGRFAFLKKIVEDIKYQNNGEQSGFVTKPKEKNAKGKFGDEINMSKMNGSLLKKRSSPDDEEEESS